MNRAKIDRLHAELGATLVTVSLQEEATPQEALIGAMRLFSHLVAAYVYDRDRPREAMHSEIAAHCHDALMMAQARWRAVCDHVLNDEAGASDV
ncbi:MAG TPA: hypothetical protein VLQ80_02650 [Candidatus Saccharimonadia bacterium]|nr:hypothetical protein [Candidatus Saccharimonadia bacterium]